MTVVVSLVVIPSMYIWSTQPSSVTAWKIVTKAYRTLSYESAPSAGLIS